MKFKSTLFHIIPYYLFFCIVKLKMAIESQIRISWYNGVTFQLCAEC